MQGTKWMLEIAIIIIKALMFPVNSNGEIKG